MKLGDAIYLTNGCDIFAVVVDLKEHHALMLSQSRYYFRVNKEALPRLHTELVALSTEVIECDCNLEAHAKHRA